MLLVRVIFPRPLVLDYIINNTEDKNDFNIEKYQINTNE